MSSHFREVDRHTLYQLPLSLQDWLPENHLARFVVEMVEQLDLRESRFRECGLCPVGIAVLIVLWLCDRRIFEPQAGTGELCFGGVSVYHQRHTPEPCHDCAFVQAIYEGFERVVCADTGSGEGDGSVEVGYVSISTLMEPG